MICLGVESTAHTFGVGIASEDKILSNVKVSYRPKTGGIHPREASDFLAENVASVICEAVSKAGINFSDVDVVAFSRSPGIGPCLRVGATAAKALALELGKPLIGVNHCIAHVEIARRMTGLNDPVVLYTSGANTQVIAFQGGRYRVFAETLDMGVGNFIDSFARYAGIPFPGGPKIEELALKGKYVELPYVVKGMDVSLTGILTNLRDKIKKQSIEDLCYSLQETVFAMLVEVSERALAHCQKREFLLTGGVAANKRLREMCKVMCDERGANFNAPALEYCVDNGAMIAVTGLMMYKAGVKQSDYGISQDERTDQVEVAWRSDKEVNHEQSITRMPESISAQLIAQGEESCPQDKAKRSLIAQGAESKLWRVNDSLIKERVSKSYRIKELDLRIRKSRTNGEARMLKRVEKLISVPKFREANNYCIFMDYIDAPVLRDLMPVSDGVLLQVGGLVGALHSKGVIHGDLTTSNMLVKDGVVFLIDFGLSEVKDTLEAKAVDLHVLKQALESKHYEFYAHAWRVIEKAYVESYSTGKLVLERLKIVESRGRYKEKICSVGKDE